MRTVEDEIFISAVFAVALGNVKKYLEKDWRSWYIGLLTSSEREC